MVREGLASPYRWLSNSTFIWTYRFAGGFVPLMRLQNLLLHCANVLLLYVFLQRLFSVVLGQDAGCVTRHRWWAAIGAAWYGLNPAGVFTVAYLIQRSILMSTFFSLAALLCTLHLVTSKNRRMLWGLGVFAAYTAALLSKEHAIALPALLIALTLLVSPSTLKGGRLLFLLLAALGMAAIFILVSGATIARPYEGHALAMLSMQEVTRGVPLIEIAYPLSVLTQCALFFKYLALWALPVPQWMSIDMHPPFFAALWGGQQALALLGFIGWGVCGFVLLRRGGAVGLAGLSLLWPWLLFGTELATIRVQEIFVLYRSYLWMAGLPCLFPLFLCKVPPVLVRCLLPALLVVLLPAARDVHYSFSSNLNLWTEALQKNDLRSNSLNGRAWMYRGVARMKLGDLEGAAADMEQAIKLDPWFAEPYGNRAVIALRQGRLKDALRDCDYALEVDPELKVFRENRDLIIRLMKKKNAP